MTEPTTQEDGATKDRYARTFDVLELLADHPEGMTITEISKRLRLPISSGHNLLQRMVASEVTTVSEDLRYSLGPRAVRLGIRIVDRLEVRAAARRHLRDLARSTGEDIYLAVPLGRRVTYVDRVVGSRPVTVDIRLGQTLHLHATSVGKLLAAHDPQLRRRMFDGERPALTAATLTGHEELERDLERIREHGYAVSREEAIDGVVGFAVPIRDSYGEVVAAIHISTLRTRVSETEEQGLIEAATTSAAAVERELGRRSSDGTRRTPSAEAMAVGW